MSNLPDDLAFKRERKRQKARAHALYSLRSSPGGKILKQMMEDREKELRVAHYGSDLPVSVETVAENKGNYAELMLWYSALFQFEMNDEETP